MYVEAWDARHRLSAADVRDARSGVAGGRAVSRVSRLWLFWVVVRDAFIDVG